MWWFTRGVLQTLTNHQRFWWRQGTLNEGEDSVRSTSLSRTWVLPDPNCFYRLVQPWSKELGPSLILSFIIDRLSPSSEWSNRRVLYSRKLWPWLQKLQSAVSCKLGRRLPKCLPLLLLPHLSSLLAISSLKKMPGSNTPTVRDKGKKNTRRNVLPKVNLTKNINQSLFGHVMLALLL